jgi:hypothetical protein
MELSYMIVKDDSSPYSVCPGNLNGVLRVELLGWNPKASSPVKWSFTPVSFPRFSLLGSTERFKE